MSIIEPIARGALAWLWQTSVAAMVLVTVVLLIQLTCRRWLPARWTYILWLLVAVRLILPVAPESSFSLFNLYKGISERGAELPATPTTTSLLVVPTAISPVSTPAKPTTRLTARVVIAGTWLLGAAAYLLCCLLHYRRVLKWARRQPALCHPRLLTLLRSAQEILRYHRPVKLLVTESLTVPSVLGVIRPCLLIPQQMIATWGDEELRLAILHELIHVRRRDNVMNWALIFVQALHWFNPVVWFALRRLRSERETLCDAIVLSHLRGEEHQSYGAVLIKAAEQITSIDISPALVPIINHKQELQRRIRMITRFKPTRRIISIFGAAIALVLACLTFTGAARKEKPTPVAPEEKKEEATQQRMTEGIKVLEGEWEKIDAQIRDRESRLEKMQQELKMPDDIAEGDGRGSASEAIRKLEQFRIEAQAEIQQLKSLEEAILQMHTEARRRSVTVAYGDPQLSALSSQLATAEQNLAALTEQYSNDHPQVKTAKRVITLITKQVDERISGILEGLKVKIAAHNSRMDFINRELEQLKRTEIETRVKQRPYFQAKRDLQSLQTIRERLTLRIIQEKVDLAVSPKASPSPKASGVAPTTP